VWELAGWKILVSLFAFVLDPSGIVTVLSFLAIAAITIRHQHINLVNLGEQFSFGPRGGLFALFLPAISVAGGAMKKLQEKRAAELISGGARLAFFAIFSGLFVVAAFGINFSEAAVLLGGISNGQDYWTFAQVGDWILAERPVEALGLLLAAKPGLRSVANENGGKTSSTIVDNLFEAMIVKMNGATTKQDIYLAGREFVIESMNPENRGDMGQFRQKVGEIERFIESDLSERDQIGRTRAILRIRILMEAAYVLTTLRDQFGNNKITPPKVLPVSRDPLVSYFNKIADMAKKLAKDWGSLDTDVAKMKVQGIIDVLLKFEYAHWESKRLPPVYKGSGLFDYLVDLAESEELDKLPLVSATRRMPQYPAPSRKQPVVSFFGHFPLGRLFSWVFPGKKLIDLTAVLWGGLWETAGYAVLPGGPFDEELGRAIKAIGDSRLTVGNVKILRGSSGNQIKGIKEDQFIVSYLGENGYVQVAIHQMTLDAWSQAEKNRYYRQYTRTMIEAALRHELAELDGIPHDDLVEIGLAHDGVTALFESGATAEQAQFVIRRRHALALAGRLSSVTQGSIVTEAGTKASLAAALETAFPSKIQPLARSITLGRVARIIKRDQLQQFIKSLYVETNGRIAKNGRLDRPEDDRVKRDNHIEGKVLLEERLMGPLVGLRSPHAVRVFQTNLARDILGLLHDYSGNRNISDPKARDFLLELYRLTGILHSMGGALTLGDNAKTDEKMHLGETLHSVFEGLDIKLLGEVGSRLFPKLSVEDLAGVLDEAARGYDDMRWQGIRFRNSKEAVAEALANNSGEIVIHVTENMMIRNRKQDDSERAQLAMIGHLDLLLQRQTSSSMSPPKIIFLFEGELAKVEAKNRFLSGLENVIQDEVSKNASIHWIKGMGERIQVVSLREKDKNYITVNENGIILKVDGEKLLGDLNPKSPTLFRVKQANVEWHLGSWKDKLVADIIAVIGNLVIDHSRRIEVDSARKRFLSYQA
jgi:hypothetical protein